MITAGGKNLTPANLENDLKRSRWISQAVMHADRRPFPVALITLDPEEIVHFAREHALPEDVESLSREPKVVELIQGELDRVNDNYARVEQIKRFFLLDHDLSQETGELTPTLKVKRNVVNEKYASDFDALYAILTALTQQRAGRLLQDPPPGAGLLALGGEVAHDLAHARGRDLDPVPAADLADLVVVLGQLQGDRLEAVAGDVDA